MSCELTASGREAVGWWVDRVKDGAFRPNPYYIEDNYGLFVLGEGNHRVVFGESASARGEMFDGGDCIVKLSKGGDPWANRNEILNWEYAPDDIRQFLAPVTDYGEDGYWLAMPKVKMGVESHERDSVYSAITGSGFDLDDVRTDNMGYIDGVPHVVDYGFRIDRKLSPEETEERGYGWGRVGPSWDDFDPSEV